MRDARLTPQEMYRPTYVQQPNALVNCLQQRPAQRSYNFGHLQMPRPLQSANEFTQQRPPLNASLQQPLNASLQQPLMRFPVQIQNVNYQQRLPVLSDTLRRPQMQQQPTRQYSIDNSRYSIDNSRYGAMVQTPILDRVRILKCIRWKLLV